MHQCHDALLWCIITVMHYRHNASTLWCIKRIMCQCDLLYIMFYWHDVLRCSVMNGWCIVWCVEMLCDERVMHSMMLWDAVYDEWVMHEWCHVSCVWMNDWTNEWMNEWMVNKCVCGQCRMTMCILLYFICICDMSLYLFRAFLLTNKPHIHPRTSVCHSTHEPDF